MTTLRLRRGPFLPRLVAFVLALAAIPLVASTCGGGSGPQTFARSSLIIPMDLCYQNQTDRSGASFTPYQCPQAADPGNVIRAYGLVYQLVRNNIAVYWIIDPQKSALTGPDLTISYSNGLPVLRYDWNTGGTGASPVSSHDITYRGGPFVVDGSDYARASQVLQNYKSLYGAVKVHVSNVAFTANVAKTMAGGWNAGGSVPPKLALLDIGSSGAGAKNSEFVIQGYLSQAGLDFAGAGGCVTPVNSIGGTVRPECGSSTPTHGQIYDRLYMEDFWPDGTGAVTSTNLFKEGYQILWVPHWAAPTSCSDCPAGASCSCNTKYTQAQIDLALKTIGAFSASGGLGGQGGDVFAECAGLGSFEGVSGSATYRTGATDGSTHFQTAPATAATAGLSGINSGSGAYFWPGNFSSPFLQIGDFPFTPAGGAIADYASTVYRPETVRLVSHSSAAGAYDVFTLLNRSAPHGTIVYLGGHSYSGNDGNFQIAGTRLVLNTLFNLGAGCVESGVACNTGLLGVCSQGVLRCDASGKQVCTQLVGPSAETCDGLDNDCNGLVDDGLDAACYDGPASTVDAAGNPRGICQKGVRSCQRRADGSYGMSACQGEVLPSSEVCNGLDDDCNGVVDDAPGGAPSSLVQPCYTGPQSSLDPASGLPRGICKPGRQACSNGVWSACDVCDDGALPWRTPASYPSCEILPHTEDCLTEAGGQQYDMNCNGVVADSCGCTLGATSPCYRGPTGTLGVGACRAGTQTCVAGTPNSWSACSGDVLPAALDCTKPPASPPADANCNGIPDYTEAACNLCPPAGDPSLVCWVNADRSAPRGTCQNGARSCADGVMGDCTGLILPAPEVCDGKDNDCNGLVDDGATCPAGLSCVNGACVPTSCGVELPCPDGYACTGGRCALANCGAAGQCALGSVCQFGQCVDPCRGVQCAAGAICASGACAGGSCYFTGCPAGELCQRGACAPDPCVGIVCPSGTFCRAGDCVQACTFVTCAAGQSCGPDGFCVPDPCAGKTCPAGQTCAGGACATDPCHELGCGQGQVCQGGACVDDPCNGITCPAGQCAAGQCYSTEHLLGSTTAPPPPAEKAGGCGCGSGSGGATSALLLLLALPLARRRRRGRLPLAGVALAVVLGGSACHKASSDTPFDPSQCAKTCEGEQRCIDVASDPVNCGACGHACGSGEICVDARCGPGSAVAPYIRSVTPPTGPKGAVAPVEITVVGERFAAGATLRTIAPAGTATYPATVTDAGQLTASLDLAGSPSTVLELRVVNPDRVISNAFPFDVVTPSPKLTAVQPVPITSGTSAALTVTGTDFIDSSKCHVRGPTTPDLALPTTPGATLACTFDTTGLPIGAYELWVVNDGALSSNHLPFSITASGAPHLVSLSPSAGAAGDTIALTVTGTSFAPGSVVSFGGTAQTTTYLDATRLLVPALPTPPSAGTYPVTVAGADNSLSFTVSATAPRADTMTPSPGSPYQGDTVTLAFSGANLIGASGATIQPPSGAAFTAPLAGTPTSTSASVTVALATACAPAACPSGLYAAALTFGGGGTSSTFQFRVLSSAAVLQSVSPAGGAQGTNPVTVTFAATNLRGTISGAFVLFRGNGIDRSLTPATWTPPGAATARLDLTGLDTGVYSLALQSAGAAASNAVSFTVTPGMPHVASVSPATVTRQDAPVLVTLGGSNFAKPDANGNAASQVMVLAGAPWAPARAYAVGDLASNGGDSYRCAVAGTSSTSGGPTGTGSTIADGTVRWAWAGTWQALSGSPVTIVSATAIQVLLDTRTAIPATYRIGVWNPPGPQKSTELVTFTVN